MIRGADIEIGGKVYTVPPLTIDQLETLEGDLKIASDRELAAKEPFGAKRLQAMARIVHSALERNYPDLKFGELKKELDLGNIGDAWAAVMGLSGLVKKEPRAGEAVAEEPPTGASSAPASAPQQDGTGTKQAG